MQNLCASPQFMQLRMPGQGKSDSSKQDMVRIYSDPAAPELFQEGKRLSHVDVYDAESARMCAHPQTITHPAVREPEPLITITHPGYYQPLLSSVPHQDITKF